MTDTWIGAERLELATTRILDAAGELFAQNGVAQVAMGDVAKAAGCSRATLYRYFPNRDVLRMAFVQRSARRVGADVAQQVAGVTYPADRVEKAVLLAVDAVRADPLLSVWFGPSSVGIATDLAAASEVIESLAEGFVGVADQIGTEDPGRYEADAARWIVRVVVSLLSMPGRDRSEEVGFVRNVLVPAVVRPERD